MEENNEQLTNEPPLAEPSTDNDIADNAGEEKATEQSSDSTVSITKNILLYRNGDKYYPGKKFVINPRYVRTWNYLLEDITRILQPRSGAIRDIRTPVNGTRVRSLEDLTNHGRYVAVPTGERIKLIDYENTVNVNHQTQPRRNINSNPRLKPIRSRNVSPEKGEGKGTNLQTKSIVIHVYRNGDPFTRAINVVLRPLEQQHMRNLVRAIEERVLLQTNRPIRKLYNMTGEKIKFAKDVEEGQYFVAASNEPFQDINYGQFLPSLRGGGKISSSYRKVKYLNQVATPKHSQRSQGKDDEAEPKTARDQQRTQRSKERNKDSTEKSDPKKKQKNKEDEEKENAAIIIQASYKGYTYRQKLKTSQDNNEPPPKNEYKPNLKEEPKEEQKVQPKKNEKAKQQSQPKAKESQPPAKAAAPAKAKNQTKNETREELKSNNEEAEMAAVKIQSGFRGYKTRKEMKEKGNELNEEPSPQVNDGDQKKEEKKPNEKKDSAPPASDENDDEKHEAASKIQAGFRGYKHRKQIVNKEEDKPDPVESSQKPEERYEDPGATEEPKDTTDDNDKDKEIAATKIQAGFRGHKARKDMKDRDEAAKKIQAGFRGHQARKDMKDRDEAAKKIQAGFRGYQARKETNDRDEAAKKIQAGFRGHKARKETKDREEAAKKIQAGFKGYKVRNEMKNKPKVLSPEEQVNERNKAASIIQAGFRGHQQRKKQKDDQISK